MKQRRADGFAAAARRLAAAQRVRQSDRRAGPSVLHRRMPIILAAAYALLAGGIGIKAVVDGGTLREIAAALIAIAPMLAVLTWRSPLVFPYTLYLILIPIENLLLVGTLGTITRLLGIISAAVIVAGMVRRHEYVAPSRSIVTLGLLASWMTLTIAWEIGPGGGIGEVQSLASVAMIYLVVAMYPSSARDVRISLGAVLIGGVIASLYGIWLLHSDPSVVNEGRLEISVGEDFIDPNHFANALLVPLSIAIVATFRATSIRARAAFGAAGFVILAAISSTLSREALLAIAGMLIYFLIRGPYRRQAGIVLAGGVAWVVSQPSFLARIADASASEGAGRYDIWKVGIAAFLHHPFIGTGVGSFAFAYDDFYLNVYQRYSGGWERASHNVFLHYAVELGIVGIVLLVLFVRNNFTMLRSIGRSHPLYDVRLAAEGGLVAIVIASFFIDLFTYKYAWVALYLIVQVRAAAIRGERTNPLGEDRRAAPAGDVVNYFAPAHPTGAS